MFNVQAVVINYALSIFETFQLISCITDTAKLSSYIVFFLLLQQAFCDLELEAIYLLSDGKPDTSTQHVLKEVAQMNEHRQLKIHTMSFHCEDKSANSFLKVCDLLLYYLFGMAPPIVMTACSNGGH